MEGNFEYFYGVFIIVIPKGWFKIAPFIHTETENTGLQGPAPKELAKPKLSEESFSST